VPTDDIDYQKVFEEISADLEGFEDPGAVSGDH